MNKTEILEEFDKAVNDIAEALNQIEFLIKNHTNIKSGSHEYAKIFAPDLFGSVSAFIQGGRGCEPAFYNGYNADDIRDELDSEIEDETDDDNSEYIGED